MTFAERGRRLGRLAAWLVPSACVKIGIAVGALLQFPAAAAWPVGIIGLGAFVGFCLFARHEIREEERAAEAAKVPKPPEQIGAEIYALHKKPLTLTIELNQKGREALVQLAAKKGLSVEQAYLYAAQIVANGDGEIRS